MISYDRKFKNNTLTDGQPYSFERLIWWVWKTTVCISTPVLSVIGIIPKRTVPTTSKQGQAKSSRYVCQSIRLIVIARVWGDKTVYEAYNNNNNNDERVPITKEIRDRRI